MRKTLINYVKIMLMNCKEATAKFPEYEEHARDNELEILVSKDCLCFGCGHVFSARDIKNWVKSDDGLSAMCPECGLPHIVGDASGLAVGQDVADALSDYRESLTDKETTRREYVDFCSQFFDGKVEDSPRYEELYVLYLGWLLENFEEPLACLNLARVYARGLRYVDADVDRAIAYYSDPILAYDAQGLYELGLLYDRRNAKGDPRRAFESFSKSAALGSLSASLSIANYYMQGKFVAQDQLFGANAMYSVFGEMYGKAFTDLNTLPEFATCAYNLGLCYYHGLGVKKSNFRALRYYLISSFAANYLKESGGPEMEWTDEAAKMIAELTKDLSANSDVVVYDEDTFYDSFAEQQDAYTEKTITQVEYLDNGASLRLGIELARPFLFVDCGNAKLELTKSTEWTFPGAQFELHPTERRYERVEFIGDYIVNFVHEDPVYGDVVTLKIEFPPNPNAEENKE